VEVYPERYYGFFEIYIHIKEKKGKIDESIL